MRHLVVSLVFVASSVALAAGPTQAEKIAGIATAVKSWRAHPKDSPAGQQMAMAVTVLVLEASGAAEPLKPTEEDQKRMVDVIAALKKQGADPSEAVDALLAQFRNYACASKQTEAKANLRGIYTAQRAYQAEFGTYDKDLKKVGFEPMDAKRYKYEVVKADKNSFTVRAVGIGDMVGDEWTVDEKGSPTATKNLCPR